VHWTDGDDLVACVEKVGAMPGQGVAGMFSLGNTAGVIEGVLTAHDVPVHYVTPRAWTESQRAGKDKGFSVAACNANWPSMAANWTLKKHHNRCDAALIAKHGWEVLA
jgi:crossover junction endodeoxyribonuclease RuvC